MYEIRIIDGKQFRTNAQMSGIIGGVEKAYSLFSSGQAGLWPIISHEFEPGKSEMDIKSGYMDGAGIYGLKILGWKADNPQTLGVPALSGFIMVMGTEHQQPIGLVDGGSVTFYRTGAAGAVGAKYLARPQSEKAVIVGCGAQGRAQLMGLATVMKNLKEITLFDIHDTAAQKMEEETSHLYPTLAIKAKPYAELDTYLADADIIVTCTVSHSKFIKAGIIKKGTHINAIGADMKGKQELDPNLFAGAKVFCDSAAQVTERGESQYAFAQGLISGEAITEIGNVINGVKPGRTSEDEITIFDATGMALQDIITAKVTLDYAEEANIGTVLCIEQ